jgi:hypothetical protein
MERFLHVLISKQYWLHLMAKFQTFITYKRRLATYNLKNGDGTCYVWNGTIAKRGAKEIGSCLLNFLQTYFNDTVESPSNVIFYSDNCAGQNKNKFITSLYIYAVLIMNI